MRPDQAAHRGRRRNVGDARQGPDRAHVPRRSIDCAPPASSSPSPAGGRRAGWRCWSSRCELTTPIAAFNGGMFVKPDLTTVIEQRTLPLAVAREVVDYLLQAGLDVWVYRGADWFIRERERAPRRARADRRFSSSRR